MSVDDELLDAALGEGDGDGDADVDQEMSGDDMLARAAFYDGRSRSDTTSNSRSRSSSPMRMQMKPLSALRQQI